MRLNAKTTTELRHLSIALQGAQGAVEAAHGFYKQLDARYATVLREALRAKGVDVAGPVSVDHATGEVDLNPTKDGAA